MALPLPEQDPNTWPEDIISIPEVNKLRVKHIHFIMEFIKAENIRVAAENVGLNYDYARQLIGKADVKAAIQAIKMKALATANMSTAWVVQNLTATYMLAIQKEDLGIATRNLELLGRYTGAFEKDNKQKGGKVVVNMNFTRPDNPQVQAIIDVEPIKAIE